MSVAGGAVPSEPRAGRRSTLARPVAARDAMGKICGSLPLLLSPEQERTIRRAWAAGATAAEAAELAGIPVGRIRQRLQDQLRDLPRRGRGVGSSRRSAPPSPEEIAYRAALVRLRWPEDRWLGRDANQDPDSRQPGPIDPAAG